MPGRGFDSLWLLRVGKSHYKNVNLLRTDGGAVQDAQKLRAHRWEGKTNVLTCMLFLWMLRHAYGVIAKLDIAMDF